MIEIVIDHPDGPWACPWGHGLALSHAVAESQRPEAERACGLQRARGEDVGLTVVGLVRRFPLFLPAPF